jgi:hypothetical protein
LGVSAEDAINELADGQDLPVGALVRPAPGPVPGEESESEQEGDEAPA